MSRSSEEMALRAYPEKDVLNKKATGHYDANYPRRKAYQQGYEQAEKDIIPLINRLCEAILFDWEDKVELAWKIQSQIKAREI